MIALACGHRQAPGSQLKAAGSDQGPSIRLRAHRGAGAGGQQTGTTRGPPAAWLGRSGGGSGAARLHRRRPRTGNLGSLSRARGRPGAAATPWLRAPGRARITPGHTRWPDCLEGKVGPPISQGYRDRLEPAALATQDTCLLSPHPRTRDTPLHLSRFWTPA